MVNFPIAEPKDLSVRSCLIGAERNDWLEDKFSLLVIKVPSLANFCHKHTVFLVSHSEIRAFP